MKIGICDDKSNVRRQMKKSCVALGYDDIVMFSSGDELLESKDLPQLHLLFLDIEMEGTNGIDVKTTLETAHPSTFIAFITTHQELMPEAFGHNVIAFLTKPFMENAIKTCILRAEFLVKEFYPLPIGKGKSIPCNQILFLRSEHKYTIFHTLSGETYSSRIPIKQWAIDLDVFGFCPISRSTIINLKYYKIVQNREVFLHQNIQLPVSRRFIHMLDNKYSAYMIHKIRHD